MCLTARGLGARSISDELYLGVYKVNVQRVVADKIITLKNNYSYESNSKLGLSMTQWLTHSLVWLEVHKSGITLWPLTGEVNNADYLFIMAPVGRWDRLQSRQAWGFERVWHGPNCDKAKSCTNCSPCAAVLEMLSPKSISKTAALVGCFQSAAVRTVINQQSN